jgi:hypothetical protein
MRNTAENSREFVFDEGALPKKFMNELQYQKLHACKKYPKIKNLYNLSIQCLNITLQTLSLACFK